MTDACRALVKHALGELELNRVEIHCAAANVASSAIPQRLGFTHEATLREALLLHGTYHDRQIWGFLKRDWRG
jgi:ribosomal-protein-serine acetyltransferase